MLLEEVLKMHEQFSHVAAISILGIGRLREDEREHYLAVHEQYRSEEASLELAGLYDTSAIMAYTLTVSAHIQRLTHIDVTSDFESIEQALAILRRLG